MQFIVTGFSPVITYRQGDHMKKYILGIMLIFSLLGLAACSAEQVVGKSSIRTGITHVETHPSQGDVRKIAGGEARLVADETGIFVNMTTDELEDNHVYTLWVITINNPEVCQANPCTPPEILGQSDALHSNVTWGDSLLYSDEARMEFTAFLPVGEVVEGWFGNGLTNPLGAEIHLIINDHGEVIPEMAANMLNTYRGGCSDDSLPPPFPDSAKADGESGPNPCRLIQDAVFMQDKSK
jgi:hypothetical protein